MQRHHDAVVEFPLLGVCHVDVLQGGLDQAPGEVGGPRHGGARYTQPVRVLYRALVLLPHAHAIGGHIVHEEVGEMLGGNHDQGLGPTGFQRLPHSIHGGVQRAHILRVRHGLAAGYPRPVGTHPGKYQAHIAPLPSVVTYSPALTSPCSARASRMAWIYSGQA